MLTSSDTGTNSLEGITTPSVYSHHKTVSKHSRYTRIDREGREAGPLTARNFVTLHLLTGQVSSQKTG